MKEFKGPIAFAGVMLDTKACGDCYGLGVAEQGVEGYRPYSGISYPTHEQATAAANGLNAEMGLSPLEAAKIIASTMFGHGRRRRVSA